MASRTYQNFDLLLESAEAGQYRARVTSCPVDECPSGTFAMPFDGTALENLLLKLDPGRSGTRRSGATPAAQASVDLGGGLFEAVFSEDILLAWSRSQDVSRAAGKGLRLRLRLTDAPAIAGLPWEMLYDRRGNSFIAQSERTPVVRYLEVPQPPRPLAVDGALKILVVISSPTDLPELDVDAEWDRVHEALASKVDAGLVQIDRLPSPTVAALSTWLRHHEVHILHFIGHGDYDQQQQDGVLYFSDRYGRSSKVSPTVLGPYLRDHDPLRLVLLNACQSARVDTTDPFSGMAQGLVQQDCTAVVAMQFPISDGAAVAFTGEFYGAIADGLPVDQAATSARKALLGDYAAEWATPVLFLRAPDGRVFDHIVPEPPIAATGLAPEPAPIAEPELVTEPEPTAAPEPSPEPEPSPGPEPEPIEDPAPPPIDDPPPPQPEPTRQPGPQYYYAAAPQPQPQPQYASVHQPPQAAYLVDTGQTRRPRTWVKVAAVAAGVLLLAFVALAWYGSTLPDSGGITATTNHDPANSQAQQSTSTLTGPSIAATHLTTGLTIDGDVADWPSDTHTVDSNTLIAGSQQTVQATWGLAWDDTNFYVVADVTDPTRTQTHGDDTSQLFKGDGVSFEIGTSAPQNGDASLEKGDLHVLMGPEDFTNGKVLSAINTASGRSFVKGASSIQGLDAATVTTDHGYRIEAAIPWSTLGVSGVQAGAELGMNLNVSDAVADGGNKGALRDMVSNNAARKGNDAAFRSAWGTLQLEG